MLLTILQAAEEGAEHEPLIHPVYVGLLAFGALFLLLMILLSFGKGREHT